MMSLRHALIALGFTLVVGSFDGLLLSAAAAGKYSSKYDSAESRDRYPEYPGGKALYYRKGEGGDLAGELDANRKLNAEDLRLLLELSAFAVDKQYAWNVRGSALRDLGRLGHSYAIPALAAVLGDEQELVSVRQDAAQALTRIRDPRAVDHLIEDALGSGIDVLANDTLVALKQFIGATPPQLWDLEIPGGVVLPPDHPKELPGYIETWKSWWATHRDVAEFDTTSARYVH